jgi:hypothetical protein
MLNAKVSRAAGRVMALVKFEDRAKFIAAIQNAQTIEDVAEPWRTFILENDKGK